MLDDDTDVQFSPICSNVEQLTLGNVGVSLRLLTKFILSCKKLKCSSYCHPVDEQMTRNLTALSQLLETFTNSLEEVQVFNLPCVYIGSLPRCPSAFTRISSLVCDASVLAHPSRRRSTLSIRLPNPMRMIQIHEIYADFWRQFGDFGAVCEDLAQVLRFCLRSLLRWGFSNEPHFGSDMLQLRRHVLKVVSSLMRSDAVVKRISGHMVSRWTSLPHHWSVRNASSYKLHSRYSPWWLLRQSFTFSNSKCL